MECLVLVLRCDNVDNAALQSMIRPLVTSDITITEVLSCTITLIERVHEIMRGAFQKLAVVFANPEIDDSPQFWKMADHAANAIHRVYPDVALITYHKDTNVGELWSFPE